MFGIAFAVKYCLHHANMINLYRNDYYPTQEELYDVRLSADRLWYGWHFIKQSKRNLTCLYPLDPLGCPRGKNCNFKYRAVSGGTGRIFCTVSGSYLCKLCKWCSCIQSRHKRNHLFQDSSCRYRKKESGSWIWDWMSNLPMLRQLPWKSPQRGSTKGSDFPDFVNICTSRFPRRS